MTGTYQFRPYVTGQTAASLRALAVDDNATNRTLSEQQLSGFGMRVDPRQCRW